MPARTGPNRCHPRKGRAANRNRRRRQNNGTPSNVNAGNDATGNVTNAENNVVVDVAANNAPDLERILVQESRLRKFPLSPHARYPGLGMCHAN